MASITIRNSDDGVKRRLRVRAAENGRSMEEEAHRLPERAQEPHRTRRISDRSGVNVCRICTRVALALMAAACAGTDAHGEMTLTHVEAGVYSSLRERTYLVFESADDFALWYRDLHSHRLPPPPVPRIDFRQYLAVAVAMGHRPSGGYGIRLSDVALDGDTIKVTVLERQPAPGTAQIAVVTSPYAIETVVRGEFANVAFVGPDGRVLAVRKTDPTSRE